MIVFDLACAHGHRFEGWFNSSAGFADQRERRLIACPICNDTDVDKAVMAPRLAAKGNQRAMVPASGPDAAVPMTTGTAASEATISEAAMRALVAVVAAKQAEMLPQSRWVGRDFAPRCARDARRPCRGRTDPRQRLTRRSRCAARGRRRGAAVARAVYAARPSELTPRAARG